MFFLKSTADQVLLDRMLKRGLVVIRPMFSAECTIGMVWGSTPLKNYGNKALWQ